MTSEQDRVTSTGVLLLRVGIGGLMLVHGIAKIQAFSEMSAAFPDPIGLGSQLSLIMAIGAEVGCSVLLIVGFVSRLATIPLAFTMLIALLIVHKADPWNTKELAAVYLLVYLSLLLSGPGRFSLDRVWRTRCSTGESVGTELVQ